MYPTQTCRAVSCAQGEVVHDFSTNLKGGWSISPVGTSQMARFTVGNEKAWGRHPDPHPHHVLLGGHTLWFERGHGDDALTEGVPGPFVGTAKRQHRSKEEGNLNWVGRLVGHLKSVLLGRPCVGGRG